MKSQPVTTAVLPVASGHNDASILSKQLSKEAPDLEAAGAYSGVAFGFLSVLLVFGIFSGIGWLLELSLFAGPFIALAGIVTSTLGSRSKSHPSLALTGLVFSLLALFVDLLVLLFFGLILIAVLAHMHLQ